MARNEGGEGKGVSKGVSPAQHAENRRAAKARKRSHRSGPGNSGSVSTLRTTISTPTTNSTRIYGPALRLTVEMIEEYASHTFMVRDQERPRWSPEVLQAAIAYTNYLFTNSQEELLAARSLTDKVKECIRKLFVIVCERQEITGIFGQKTPWYGELISDLQVQREIKRLPRSRHQYAS